MGNKAKIRKAERDVKQNVEKLKRSIKEQYGIGFEEWIKREKEKIHEYSNR